MNCFAGQYVYIQIQGVFCKSKQQKGCKKRTECKYCTETDNYEYVGFVMGIVLRIWSSYNISFQNVC